MQSPDASQNLKVTAMLWVMVAGVCALVANVIAAGLGS